MQAMENLPQELVVEILLRLPIKSLVRFRCLSKPWLSYISNPHFARLHFKRASQDPNITTHKILLSTSPHLKSLDYEASCVDTDTFRLVDLYFPFKRPNSCVKILGSCNGLVCIALDKYKDFFVWNPSTGDYKKLPDPDITSNGSKYVYGFGYDVSSDDYKVVLNTWFEGASIFKVFKMSTDSWRSIQDHDDYHVIESESSQGYLLNGALHWLASWFGSLGDFDEIIAFDLAEETFWKVPMPPDVIDGEEIRFNNLGVVGDCLCLSCNVDTDNGLLVKLWPMKEYGVEGSWGRWITVGSYREFDYDCQLVPLCFTKSGHIISLNNREELIWCGNRDERMIKKFMVCDDGDLCEAVVYVESLISPNALNEIEG